MSKASKLLCSFHTQEEGKLQLLYAVDGLHALVKQFFPGANDMQTGLLMEFVLHGLAAYSSISKKIFETQIEFKDLFGSMLNIGSTHDDDDEELGFDDDEENM